MTDKPKPKFGIGDFVERKDNGTLMNVEGFQWQGTFCYVWCVWTDESEKQRKLRFQEDQLNLVARSTGSMMR